MEQEKKSLEESVKQAGSTVKGAINETIQSTFAKTKGVGDALESAAGRIREHLPEGGKVGEAADVVSRGIKHTSTYLQQQGVGGIVEDLEVLIRRYPLQTLLLGVGCGYLLSRIRTD